MKVSKLILMAVFAFSLGQSGCFLDTDGCTDPDATNYDSKADNDDGTCEYADPDGTQFLILGKNCGMLNALDFSFGTAECDTCIGSPNDRGTDIYYNGTNFNISADTSCFGQSSLGIYSVGQICCLGEIKTIPTEGFAPRGFGGLSHGYVIRCREGDYARMFLDRLILNDFGQPDSVEIYFQYPFQ